MPAVRYAALLALVVWVGGLIALGLIALPSTLQALRAVDPGSGAALASAAAGAVLERFHLVEYACGAIVLVSLFAIKFIGPAPRGFIPRIAIAFVMLVLAAVSGVPVARAMARVQARAAGPIEALPAADARRVELDRLRAASAALMAANAGLGLVLLGWYVRE
ncbi:MAG: hypothetical protein IT176_14990 [Acidobacteria bacterium]|nr:hypothetical protein [Acidobacteriota bacterium]